MDPPRHSDHLGQSRSHKARFKTTRRRGGRVVALLGSRLSGDFPPTKVQRHAWRPRTKGSEVTLYDRWLSVMRSFTRDVIRKKSVTRRVPPSIKAGSTIRYDLVAGASNIGSTRQAATQDHIEKTARQRAAVVVPRKASDPAGSRRTTGRKRRVKLPNPAARTRQRPRPTATIRAWRTSNI